MVTVQPGHCSPVKIVQVDGVNPKPLHRSVRSFLDIFRTTIELTYSSESKFSREKDVVSLSRTLEPRTIVMST
jgi:hypothetical protein